MKYQVYILLEMSHGDLLIEQLLLHDPHLHRPVGMLLHYIMGQF